MPVAFDSTQSLNEIQQHFSLSFPDLKLEFQFKGNERFNQAALTGKVFTQVQLSELLPQAKGANLELEDSMTIEEVEEMFGKHFGIMVQIFLRKGGYWLKNNLMGSLTLSPMSLQ
jgi:hypothetical protein